jgi:MYXO-CTERM domain-containing protein
VIDRAQASEMDLRFRSPGTLALAGTAASVTIGSTKLTIDGTGGMPQIAPPPAEKDCYKDEDHKGACTAARFPVTDYRVQVAGPAPQAVHVIGATADGAAKSQTLGDGTWSGVHLTGVRDAVVVWRANNSGPFSYAAPKSTVTTHVILDAPEQDGKATVEAHADGNNCAVSVTPGGDTPARPVVVTLDASCKVTADVEAAAASAIASRPSRVNEPHSARGGCCGAEAAPGSSAAMALVVLAFATRRRKR